MSEALIHRRFFKLSASAESNINRSSADMRSKWALRNCSRAELQDNIAQEMRKTVIEAAEPGVPGEGVKSTLQRAHRNLGRPKFWRVRAAWKGEAGDWAGWALDDFRERIDALRRQRRKRDLKEAADVGNRIASLRSALAQADPDFFGPEVDALGQLLERASRGQTPDGDSDST